MTPPQPPTLNRGDLTVLYNLLDRIAHAVEALTKNADPKFQTAGELQRLQQQRARGPARPPRP